MSQVPRGSARKGGAISILALILMIGVAIALVMVALRPRTAFRTDTRLESGLRLTFVLLAPTSTGNPDYIDAVAQAKSAMREYAAREGLLFSTVGISDDWNVHRGLQILAAFGAFDEIVVGRNWFNLGVARYISDMNAIAAVPQVVVTLQEISVDTIPFRFGMEREIARFVGRRQVLAWAKNGFSIQAHAAANGRELLQPVDRTAPVSPREPH